MALCLSITQACKEYTDGCFVRCAEKALVASLVCADQEHGLHLWSSRILSSHDLILPLAPLVTVLDKLILVGIFIDGGPEEKETGVKDLFAERFAHDVPRWVHCGKAGENLKSFIAMHTSPSQMDGPSLSNQDLELPERLFIMFGELEMQSSEKDEWSILPRRRVIGRDIFEKS
ncbi:hypothetical protein Tco_0857823 [Tanacetum coccineum]|uniref:Uncharacterized protein n=1 Tax=Tanacetum coccineum TaxID=301880 RepID=A0ABQ5B887_9ASTR